MKVKLNKWDEVDLDPWQEEVLNTKGNIVLRSGRQTGKSTVISKLASDFAVQNKNKVVMIIANGERGAFLLFEKVLAYMEANHKTYMRKGKQHQTKSKLDLTNGTRIYCLPTGLDGRGIRGYTVDLLIADEAAFIPREVFSSITPMISTRIDKGARLILLSTPFGRDNYFAETFDDTTYTKFHVSSEDCGRLDAAFLENEKRRMSKMAYAQEYLGEFADDDMQFFSDELIRSCLLLAKEAPKEQGKYYLGSDIARMGEDESTFEVLELKNSKLYHRENISTSKTLLNETTEFIKRLDRKWQFNKIFLDSEGLGIAIYDWLIADPQTKRKTVGVKNSTKIDDKSYNKPRTIMKEELYINLRSLMQKGDIQLLADDELFYALRSIQFEHTTDSLGRAQLKIWGIQKQGEKRDHIVEGLIRAAIAIKYKHLSMWFSSFSL